MTRVIYIFRAFLTFCGNRGVRPSRVCSMNLCHANMMFAFKVEMEKNPLRLLILWLVITLFVSSYGIRIFETPLILLDVEDARKLDY